MRSPYIIPTTKAQSVFRTGTICVGSIHGSEGLKYGGGSDGSDENKTAF